MAGFDKMSPPAVGINSSGPSSPIRYGVFASTGPPAARRSTGVPGAGTTGAFWGSVTGGAVPGAGATGAFWGSATGGASTDLRDS